MIQVYKISEALAIKLTGKVCMNDNQFNPTQDADGNWFISVEEVANNTNYRYADDLKGLLLIDYKPKVVQL